MLCEIVVEIAEGRGNRDSQHGHQTTFSCSCKFGCAIGDSFFAAPEYAGWWDGRIVTQRDVVSRQPLFSRPFYSSSKLHGSCLVSR